MSSFFTHIQVSFHWLIETNFNLKYVTNDQYSSSRVSTYRRTYVIGRRELNPEFSLRKLWTKLDTGEKGRPCWFLRLIVILSLILDHHFDYLKIFCKPDYKSKEFFWCRRIKLALNLSCQRISSCPDSAVRPKFIVRFDGFLLKYEIKRLWLPLYKSDTSAVNPGLLEREWAEQEPLLSVLGSFLLLLLPAV